jgi:hypothetical protein
MISCAGRADLKVQAKALELAAITTSTIRIAALFLTAIDPANVSRGPVLEPQPVDSLEIASGVPLSFFGRHDRGALLTPKKCLIARGSEGEIW